MKTGQTNRLRRSIRMRKQRGVVLFFALIAMIVIMLAAVALTRSVDTTTVIAGNLAFKQAANASADVGLSRAMEWLTKTQRDIVGLDPFGDPTHPFNVTDERAGYYSFVDPALDLAADSTWTTKSADAETDASGNHVRYIIQRMCRQRDQVLSEANCLFSDANAQTDSMGVKPYGGAGMLTAGSSPLIRITVRVEGQRGTVSYTQAFVF